MRLADGSKRCNSPGIHARKTTAANVGFICTPPSTLVQQTRCTGPGSRHIAQANDISFDDTYGLRIDLNDRSGSAWVMNAVTGIAELSPTKKPVSQPDACGRCHSRRSQIAKSYEYGKPLTDTHLPSLLEAGLYHADGRILDEVYVYGSFVQSKMYRAGVTCSDCHDPHSGTLRAGPYPNNTCATCHLSTTFATADHSAENIGDCVSCHMPVTTYMGVDDRRDHSFRLPGTSGDPDHYGAIIAAGRAGNANDELLSGIGNELFPAIARATMLTLLEPSDDALKHLKRATELDTSEPQFLYVYGVALNSLGRPDDAVAVLQDGHNNFPEHFDIAWALATIYRDLGDRESARRVTAQLQSQHPGIEQVEALVRSLQE